jgi:hypothetical protein
MNQTRGWQMFITESKNSVGENETCDIISIDVQNQRCILDLNARFVKVEKWNDPNDCSICDINREMFDILIYALKKRNYDFLTFDSQK